ncbi:MAG: type I-C CRISPR-associated protein Cas8c/Csd1, partial [Thermotogota bacterium]|nr:type I-C CRISPR-associated protein Cas8c/Csd1 [Thermotogota bacterium]
KKFEKTKNIKFYILGLSPNASRLSVRFWYISTVKDIRRKIGQHFKNLAITKNYENELEFPGIWHLIRETAVQGKSENISPLLAGAFMRSILTGLMYPSGILIATLERIRAEQKINYLRAALIKAYIVRKSRFQNKEEREVIGMSLNKEEENIGYRLGRLFAVLEKAQKDAVPGANTTIKDRYYGSASTTPSIVFPQLLNLAQHHIQKSKYGMIVDKQIEHIVQDIQKFPPHLSLEEQGIFALGYYHQKQDLYKKMDKKEK